MVNYEKMKMGELKKMCKELKISQTGDKGVLIWRIKTWHEGEKYQINGQNPLRLKPAEVRKAVAQRGISPIGTNDELLTALVEYLKKQPSAAADGDSDDDKPISSSTSKRPREGVDKIAVATEVLRLGEQGAFVSILRLLGDPVEADSTVGLMRKAYLKISMLIHPDKMSGFDGATKAFQELVNAFEHLSKPEMYADEEMPEKKATAISRSNAGCVRTHLACPRCEVPWGAKVEGNPEYCYNFMMMALKRFNCATCLLEFGCMTAVHSCPYCKSAFDYHPDDFHRQVSCGNKKCNKKFGFHMYHVADRLLKELREEVKVANEARIRKQEAVKRRTAAANRRRGNVSEAEQRAEQEKAFVMGLADCCPRCGEELRSIGDEEAQLSHLRDCNDSKKHAAHKRKKQQQADKAEAIQEADHAQTEVENMATWSLLGGNSSGLWLLSEEQLIKQCSESGLEVTGNKNELIARLAQHRSGQKALGDGSNEAPAKTVDPASLPSNMHLMSEDQLRSVCAAHGVDTEGMESKSDIVEALESIKYKSFVSKEEQPKMLAY